MNNDRTAELRNEIDNCDVDIARIGDEISNLRAEKDKIVEKRDTLTKELIDLLNTTN